MEQTSIAFDSAIRHKMTRVQGKRAGENCVWKYEASASLGQVNKWGVAKLLQNLPSVLRRKSRYQQEIPVTSLRELPAMESREQGERGTQLALQKQANSVSERLCKNY
jgi:hypothetical protein